MRFITEKMMLKMAPNILTPEGTDVLVDRCLDKSAESIFVKYIF